MAEPKINAKVTDTGAADTETVRAETAHAGTVHAGTVRAETRRRRWIWVLAIAAAPFLLPLAATVTISMAEGGVSWRDARRDSSDQAPDPKHVQAPVVQVYTARAWGWRKALGVHSWITTKRRGAEVWHRYEVVGWGVHHGRSAVRAGTGIPDAYWYGSRPTLLADYRGDEVEALIDRIEDAVARYPYPDRYRVWPGPNSNSFTAYVIRETPDFNADLPPTAIGKDYLPGGRIFAPSPSGSGYQVSLGGMAGIMVAVEEGLEINLLGLTIGIDLNPPALKVPGFGRIGK